MAFLPPGVTFVFDFIFSLKRWICLATRMFWGIVRCQKSYRCALL